MPFAIRREFSSRGDRKHYRYLGETGWVLHRKEARRFATKKDAEIEYSVRIGVMRLNMETTIVSVPDIPKDPHLEMP